MKTEFKTFSNFSLTENAHPYIACAFYTESYADEVKNLLASLKEFNLPYHIQYYKSRGYWEANTLIKPEFLLACMEQFPGKDLVYLDADSVVRANPTLFEHFEGDVGVFISPPGRGYSHRFLTGTLYLKNNESVRAFLHEWIASQKKYVLSVDQDSFETAVDANPGLSIQALPASYVKIFDKGDELPVIEHFQASRKQIKVRRVVRRVVRGSVFSVIIFLIIYFLFYK